MKIAFAVLVVIVLAAVLFISSRPARYHIERSTTVAAAPEVVYAQVVDFHRWAEWSPWEKLDPTMTKTFSGAASGAGAVYDWSGTGRSGQGRMTILDAQPASKVDIKLEFIKPFAATCTTAFALAPDGAGTRVTWTMDGTNDFMGKTMCLFVDMDKSVGGDFERGLATLKAVAEKAGPGAAPDSTAKPS